MNAFATYWMGELWRAAWQGAVFIAAVWVLCRLPLSLSALVRYWAWWIASIQLIVRLLVAVPLVVYITAPETPAVHSVPSTGSAGGFVVVTRAAAPAVIGLESLVIAAWVAVFVLGLVRQAARFVSARRLAHTARPLADPRATQVLGDLWGDRAGLPRLLESANVDSPLLLGWRNPAIVVRAGFAESHTLEEVRMVLSHEIAHVVRRDQWLSLGPMLVQLVFWFHPLSWLAAREVNLAREEACDLEVVRLSGASPAAYARLLLKLAQSSAPVAAMGVALGYRSLRRRIMTLKHVKLMDRPRRGVVWLCLIALAAVPWVVTARPVPQAKKKQKPAVVAQAKPTRNPATPQARTAVKPAHATANKGGRVSTTKAAVAADAPRTASTVVRGGTAQTAKTNIAPTSAQPATGVAQTAPSNTIRSGAQAPSRNPSPVATSGVARAPSSPAPVTTGGVAQPRSRSPIATTGAANSSPAPVDTGSVIRDSTVAGTAVTTGSASKAVQGRDRNLSEAARPAGLAARATDGLTEPRRDRPGSLEDLITLEFDEIEAAQAIRSILKAAGMNYAFKTDLGSTRLSCSLKNVTAKAALQTILKLIDKPVTYRIEGGTVLIVDRR